MTTIKKILLVMDSALDRSTALDRALQLARACDAELTLGVFGSRAGLGVMGLFDRQTTVRIERAMEEQLVSRLAELSKSLREFGHVAVKTLVRSGQPVCEQILAAVRRDAFDLVMKDRVQEPAIHRILYTPLDWDLLRHCPCPLWLVRKRGGGLPVRIVTAVDPIHDAHGAGALNLDILRTAQALAAPAGVSPVLYSAFTGVPPMLMSPDLSGLNPGLCMPDLYEDLRKQHQDALYALADAAGWAHSAVRVGYGDATTALIDTLREQDAELLVLGTMHRRGLDQFFLGSTAERIVSQVDCDIVAVGPREPQPKPACPEMAQDQRPA